MARRLPVPALASILLTAALAAPPAAAAPGDFLPAGTSYDPAVPTPESVLGFEVGEWHARHDQVVDYLRRLAESSDRLRVDVQGYTHEHRPLLLATISSPRNLARIEEIERAHWALSEPPYAATDTAGMPVVVWLGYSIHGDEASGTNASLLVTYHLAAAQGPEVEELLDHAVILLDPSLNPDGLGGFAEWANMNRGAVPVADPESREHVQRWPSGRTNHYWFDLNRDWLPVQHPESRARVATFQRWRPNLLADFHEMGSDGTYFFQPGVPSRQNPLTPAINLELTRAIAAYHARAFDAAGRLYYTEETFDDFYYGKGSTYPDVQGSVGILFEQASARGNRQETANGLLTFADAVRGHVLTSFSTLHAAVDQRRELLDYQADFYRHTKATSPALGGWLVGDGGDPARARQLLAVLRAHGIEVRRLGRRVEAGGRAFEPEHAWLVPADQRQVLLAEALFERRTEFADETFYDISAWTLPLAFDLPTATLDRKALAPGVTGEAVDEPALPAGHAPALAEPYAWVLDWRGYWAPRALWRLLDAGVRVRVATRPFTAETGDGRRSFGYGSLVVPRGLQSLPSARLDELLATAARKDGVDVWSLATGLTAEGVDVGSPSLRPLERPRPLLVVGPGVSAYEAGEVWHLLDARFGIALPMVEMDRLAELDLGDYSHLLLVSGRWQRLGADGLEAVRGWVRRGGVVVATGSAAEWAEGAIVHPPDKGASEEGGGEDRAAGAGAASEKEAAAEPAAERAAYADYDARAAVDLLAGAIFESELDLTHPIAYGYTDSRLPVFRASTRVLAPSDNAYENVALYTASPRLAGYASPANIAAIAGSAAVVASRVGRGTVVRIADDPAFRAFWLGPEKLLLNALFFGDVIQQTPPLGR